MSGGKREVLSRWPLPSPCPHPRVPISCAVTAPEGAAPPRWSSRDTAQRMGTAPWGRPHPVSPCPALPAVLWQHPHGWSRAVLAAGDPSPSPCPRPPTPSRAEPIFPPQTRSRRSWARRGGAGAACLRWRPSLRDLYHSLARYFLLTEAFPGDCSADAAWVTAELFALK